jgi:hypothetical protein
MFREKTWQQWTKPKSEDGSENIKRKYFIIETKFKNSSEFVKY